MVYLSVAVDQTDGPKQIDIQKMTEKIAKTFGEHSEGGFSKKATRLRLMKSTYVGKLETASMSRPFL